MAKKNYPVIRKFDITGGAQQNTVVDVGQCLSRLNHRLYRQSRVYDCTVRLRQDSTLAGVDVYALRNDWMLCKSVQKAYDAYRQATMHTRAIMSEKQIARWEDFRIDHGLSPVNNAAPLLYQGALTGAPARIGRSPMTTGEFLLSVAVDGSGVDHTFTLAASPTSAEYNIIDEYDAAADTDSAPSNEIAAGKVPYGNLEEDIDPNVLEDLETRGNSPPYDADSFQGDSPWIRVGTLGVGAAHSVLSTGVFQAPLGMILIDGYVYSGSGEGTEEGSISVEIKAGDYKGIHGPSMLEV